MSGRQFAGECFYESVAKCVRNRAEYLRIRMLKCSRERDFRAESVLRIVANDPGYALENRFPNGSDRIVFLCRIKNAHVIEHRLNVALISAIVRARFHCNLQSPGVESEIAVGFGELIQFNQ